MAHVILVAYKLYPAFNFFLSQAKLISKN